MKKPKDVSVATEGKDLKRKREDPQTSAFESKKRKKHREQSTVLPSSPKKVKLIVEKKKHLLQKKKQLVSKKPLMQHKQIKFEEKAISHDDQANGALHSNDLNPMKKKKNKVKKVSQKTDLKKVPSIVESFEGTSCNITNEFKKKKEKKPLRSAENLELDNGIRDGAAEKMKTKKKKLPSKSIDKETSVTNDDCSEQTKKKKKKKKKNHKGGLHEESASNTSENLSPSKSLQKQTKSKLHKNNENSVSPVQKGPYLGNKKNKDDSPRKVDASELPKKKIKFMKFKKQKENEVTEKGTEIRKILPLKGKALKKRIVNIRETIAKLQNFNNDQASLLLKATSEGKKNKIQARIKKIKSKIVALEVEMAEYEMKAKGKTTEIVKNKMFRGLPEDPPLAKKKEKPVDLKEFLQIQMKASRFRWLNENLYNSSSEEAQGFFKGDPDSFKAYHEGYSEQVAKWPVNPLDVIIKELKSLPEESIVADLGCGEAKLAVALPQLKVHSLDFIAIKPEVIACDMAHCPLLRSSVDVAVFCLSLMGTNVSDFLLEANRILKTGGTMEIAEVESRFDSIDDFIGKVQHYGFQLKKKKPMDMFFFLTFTKKQDVVKSKKLPEFELKPCVYKKR